MERFDILAVVNFIFALWGAGLSTYLGYRELQKEKRRIIFFLDYVAFYEIYRLKIVNVGHRPIRIEGGKIGQSVLPPRMGRLVPKRLRHKALDARPLENFVPAEDYPLPKKLDDGEQVTIDLPGPISSRIRTETGWEIYIRDAEGNSYSPDRRRTYNPKLDVYWEK